MSAFFSTVGMVIWWLIKLAVYGGVGWWLFDDSKSRDRNPFFWIIALALFLISDLFFGVFRGFWSLIIFIIFVALYIFLRPKGELIYCVECFKKKLEDLKYCPHCFHIEEEAFEEDDAEMKKESENNVAAKSGDSVETYENQKTETVECNNTEEVERKQTETVESNGNQTVESDKNESATTEKRFEESDSHNRTEGEK